MVGLRAKVLGRLGRTENSPSKSVCSILPLARHLRAGEGSSALTPARGSLLKPERRAHSYSPPTMARAPTTESTATTQKSIASMRSPLALLGGLGKIGTGFIARQLFRYVSLGELVSGVPLNFRERRENERSSGLSPETRRRGGAGA